MAETVWNQSVAGVCLREGKVLLARHTYGGGKGLWIIPGGYLEAGESPQEAVRREFLEEVGVLVEARELIGIRFNTHDWYAVFAVDYVSGEARSDGDENDAVAWMEVAEALCREDVPGLTKELLRCALRPGKFARIPYDGNYQPCALFGAAGDKEE